MKRLSFFICFIFVLKISNAQEAGQKEHVPLEAESTKFNRPHDENLDHEAILGSEKLANEYDDLSPEESKKRLRALAKRMDVDGDGFVTDFELNHWVYTSLVNLDKEETEERFREIDSDGDGAITWKEYLTESFGVEESEMPADDEDAKLMKEDRKYFDAADADHDGKLTEAEFVAFQNPEHHQQMHQTLVENTLEEKDTNKDGKIDMKEYMGETFDHPTSEWFTTEKARFTEEYDKNNDGYLEGEELRAWLIPDLKQTAKHETDHLLDSADKDGDDRLSIEEIVNAYKAFVGSEATSFGDSLLKIPHDEL